MVAKLSGLLLSATVPFKVIFVCENKNPGKMSNSKFNNELLIHYHFKKIVFRRLRHKDYEIVRWRKVLFDERQDLNTLRRLLMYYEQRGCSISNISKDESTTIK